MVGSLNADLVVRVDQMPRPGETVRGSELAVLPGGKGANQAAAAGRLGAAVSMIGAVGDDTNADLLLAAARAAGVEVGGVRRLPDTATGAALISVDASGENSIIISPGANGRLSPDHVQPSDLADAAVVTLSLEVPIETVVTAAGLARRAGAVVIMNPSPFRPVPAGLLANTDVLVLNEIELAQLLDQLTPDTWPETAEMLSSHGVVRAVVTLGAEGAVVVDCGPDGVPEITTVPAPRVEAVDTTGCGDAFTGALATRLAEGDELSVAAAFATRVAALAATEVGAQSSYPDLATVLAFDPD